MEFQVFHQVEVLDSRQHEHCELKQEALDGVLFNFFDGSARQSVLRAVATARRNMPRPVLLKAA